MTLIAALRFACLTFWLACSVTVAASSRAPLDLDGYIDWSGAVTILHRGDFVDPYFALQALLLAHENGLDITEPAGKWINWLMVRQKPDGTFDRFCRAGPVWLGCKLADTDDALLALWIRLLDTMPASSRTQPAWHVSYSKTQAALRRLLDPVRGIYSVSPALQEGLLMDNVEIWSQVTAMGTPDASSAGNTLALAVHRVFWDRHAQRFLVSTQPEHNTLPQTFYPEHVAQIYPLLFNFPLPDGMQPGSLYNRWMKQHRHEWLQQTKSDFAWGLIALLALRQGDLQSARCWLRETRTFRRTRHWTVTDDVVEQILQQKKLTAAGADAVCT